MHICSLMNKTQVHINPIGLKSLCYDRFSEAIWKRTQDVMYTFLE